MPAFPELLHSKPNIGDRKLLFEYINDMLDRQWLTNNGYYVRAFERKLSEYLGVKHVTAVCNGTIALEIMARAAGLHDEVIVPGFTCVATPHALAWQGMKPVFCDIDPRTHNIDPDKIEALITDKTTGILAVNLWGRPCNIPALIEIANTNGIRLIFDSCHAFGNSYWGEMIGNFGDAEAFSFHATKFFNTFEGGAVVTNDDEIAEHVRLMVNFGYKFQQPNEVYSVGTNGKMTEIAAAMGLVSLLSIDEFMDANKRNHHAYHEYLRDVPGIYPIRFDNGERCNYQYMIIEVDEDEAGISRDKLVDVLRAQNILVQKLFYPGCHQMEPYRIIYQNCILPETERMSKRTIALPMSASVSVRDIETICAVIKQAVLG